MSNTIDDTDDLTIVERLAKWRNPDWVKKYNKDGLIVYEDAIFGQVKLVTPKGNTIIGKDIAAIDGIVAFGKYYEGGIGGLKAYHPYVPRELMDMCRGE